MIITLPSTVSSQDSGPVKFNSKCTIFQVTAAPLGNVSNFHQTRRKMQGFPLWVYISSFPDSPVFVIAGMDR